MTMTTALAMYEELLLYDNVEVYLTHQEDEDMSLKARAEFAAQVNADFRRWHPPFQRPAAFPGMPVPVRRRSKPHPGPRPHGECHVEVLESDYENAQITLKVSAVDRESTLLYYSYSFDGGVTFGRREPWPGSDALAGTYDESFQVTAATFFTRLSLPC